MEAFDGVVAGAIDGWNESDCVPIPRCPCGCTEVCISNMGFNFKAICTECNATLAENSISSVGMWGTRGVFNVPAGTLLTFMSLEVGNDSVSLGDDYHDGGVIDIHLGER